MIWPEQSPEALVARQPGNAGVMRRLWDASQSLASQELTQELQRWVRGWWNSFRLAAAPSTSRKLQVLIRDRTAAANRVDILTVPAAVNIKPSIIDRKIAARNCLLTTHDQELGNLEARCGLHPCHIAVD